VRRCGELLKEIEKMGPKESGAMKGRGDSSPTSPRKQAAADAGLSPDQAKESIRVANVPEESFEEQLESDSPPTITNLAEQGTKKAAPRYEQLGMTKKAWQAGMHFRGHLADMARHAENFDPQEVVDGSTPKEREQMRQNIKTIDQYLDQLIAKI
jgi:predicted TPR repeat methyltransferase